MLLWLGLRYSVISGEREIITFLDNPTVVLSSFQRILNASKYQIEYLIRTLLPYSLSSDGSYNQLPDYFFDLGSRRARVCGAFIRWPFLRLEKTKS